ncbi:hypothetical protein PLESTB_000940600 [Pleodorina starrii]|uniref:Uncharacterized protein n=1 Tax=Pleodorina starrii TaxID=330485 RepID=A0A9W6BNZ2_9CHLO|nr:hypothetical protein PLESTM_000704600 [Pleodorina starrii]GLC55072.1 hypothetical protein PLESTB_000940600 [Pleodorina starrii]GLC71173.1 hypothetical protein PLESTF_001082300 [Pleodorina starrii]
MGNSASLPERVFKAVERNDVCKFQSLVANIHAADPAARTAILEYRDPESGRTPLLTAAKMNHFQILQQLIQLGANVHYMRPSGGALHEATARRHEAAVELLLAAGASPFAANAAGRTALDEAGASGHSGMVRAIEKRAEFCGLVAFKTETLGGLSSRYKVRWAVLMPYLPHVPGGGDAASASAGAGRQPLPRRQLWLYKDQSHYRPRCRMWVDGATVTTHGLAGTEATLRLPKGHGEPVGDLATGYTRGVGAGYDVIFRPADPTSPDAVAKFHQLVALLDGGSAATTIAAANQRQQPQPQTEAPSAPPPVPVPYPPPPAAAAAPPPPQPVVVPPPPPQWVPYYPVPPPLYRSVPVLGEIAPMVEAAAAVVATAAAAAAAAVFPQPLQRRHDNAGVAPGAVSGGGGSQVSGGGGSLELLEALPGESDVAFAARLASVYSATSGHSQQSLFPQHQQQQQQQQPVTASLTAAPTPPRSPNPSPSPSAPPQPPPSPPPPSEPAAECVICMSAPPEAGFLHGDSVHRCVCRACSAHVPVGAPCPLCRQPVERVLGVY